MPESKSCRGVKVDVLEVDMGQQIGFRVFLLFCKYIHRSTNACKKKKWTG